MRVLAFGVDGPIARVPLPPGARFELRPTPERLRDTYASCDAWLFPSREEGFGLPILEAMACRTPVVASRAGAAPELLAAGGGELVDADDVAGMAAAIVRVLRLPEARWREMSDQAYAAARAYSWNDATDRFEAALRRAAEGARPGLNERLEEAGWKPAPPCGAVAGRAPSSSGESRATAPPA